MIADVVDAAFVVACALLVWIAVGAAVAVLAGLGVVAGVWWVVKATCGRVRAVRRAGDPEGADGYDTAA